MVLEEREVKKKREEVEGERRGEERGVLGGYIFLLFLLHSFIVFVCLYLGFRVCLSVCLCQTFFVSITFSPSQKPLSNTFSFCLLLSLPLSHILTNTQHAAHSLSCTHTNTHTHALHPSLPLTAPLVSTCVQWSAGVRILMGCHFFHIHVFSGRDRWVGGWDVRSSERASIEASDMLYSYLVPRCQTCTI